MPDKEDRHMRTSSIIALSAAFFATNAFSTPFGGDDTGFVPPDKLAYYCESKATAANAKLRAAITLCHIDLAAQRLKGSNATDDGCETAAKAKFNNTLSKLFANPCPSCLVTNTSGMADAVETEMDGANGDFFCDGSEPLGDDDAGVTPPDATILKCEATVAKNVAKLLICDQKCHKKMAAYALKARPFDEEFCEGYCLEKYNRYRDKIVTICPACLDQAAQDQLATDTESFADSTLGTFYCAE
jgi:hypothetical protein